MRSIGTWTAHGRTIELSRCPRGFLLRDTKDGITRKGYMFHPNFRRSSEEGLVLALKWAIDVVEGRKTLEDY